MILLICVLKGAFIYFLADISRALKRIHASTSWAFPAGKGTTNQGRVQIIMDSKRPIEDRNVLIVEDIIDSGRTLEYMRRSFTRSPASFAHLYVSTNRPVAN